MANGALGGKLLGAGGGGFILLFVPPSSQERVRECLKKLIYVPFRFEFSGSRVIYFDPREEYYTEELVRASREGELVTHEPERPLNLAPAGSNDRDR
jgi:hypothetical protein